MTVDTNGIIQNAQVIEQDYLELKLSTLGLDQKGLKQHSLRLCRKSFCNTQNKMQQFDVSKGAEVFQLSFMSYEALYNHRIRLSRTFTETNSNIVKNIMRSPNILDSRKTLYLEDTMNVLENMLFQIFHHLIS